MSQVGELAKFGRDRLCPVQVEHVFPKQVDTRALPGKVSKQEQTYRAYRTGQLVFGQNKTSEVDELSELCGNRPCQTAKTNTCVSKQVTRQPHEQRARVYRTVPYRTAPVSLLYWTSK